MNWWQAVVLGIVEGITEYLPVSSTGHLLLTQRLLKISPDEASGAYAICIQAGAILAVLGLYWPQVKKMAMGLLGRDREGLVLAINIVIAFFPAAVIGVLFDKKIESLLFGIWPVAAAWFAGGLAILAVSGWRRVRQAGENQGQNLGNLTRGMALAIGIGQCLAMWPGVSRSLVTILAGILTGLNLSSAVEFSFLLGVVTLTAATVFKAHHAGAAMVHAYGWATMITGFFFSTVSAAIAVKWMVAYLNRHSLAIFGYYRLALATMAITLLITGVI